MAQHSVIVSRALPPELRLQGLLHDAHEAYISDLSTPLKASLSPCALADFRLLEARLMVAIGEALGVDLTHDPRVKHADRVALRHEAELLLPEPIDGFLDLPDDPLDDFTPWAAGVAEVVFLRTFNRLIESEAVEGRSLCLC